MIKAVIFDLDGVLIDSSKEHYLAWKRLFKEKGILINKQIFKEIFGMGNKEILGKILKRELSEKELEEFSDLKEKYYRQYMRGKSIRPMLGMKALLENLKQRFKMSIATSTPRENLNLILEKLKIKEYFEALATGDEVAKGKPNPDIFLLAAKKLGEEPQRCVVVEDALSGVEAAKRAGMKCIAITTTRKRNELEKADYIIDNLNEINIKLINQIGG